MRGAVGQGGPGGVAGEDFAADASHRATPNDCGRAPTGRSFMVGFLLSHPYLLVTAAQVAWVAGVGDDVGVGAQLLPGLGEDEAGPGRSRRRRPARAGRR